MGDQGGREEEKGGGFRGDYPTDTLLYIILTNKDVLLMMATMLFIMLVIEDNIVRDAKQLFYYQIYYLCSNNSP